MASTKMDQLQQKYTTLRDNEVILDVRSPEEYKEGHVPGSINIPVEQVTQHIQELKKYHLVHIHCRMGGRAKKAYEALASAGLENLHCIDDSGMEHWKNQGYEIEK